jgi:peptide/nickel transport system permease protein/oligopeptide transport system permease protein
MAEDLNAVERVDEFAEAVPGTPGAPEPPSRKRWRDNRTGTLMEASRSSRTLYGDAWYRLRRNKLAMVALGWLVVLVLMALTADFWVPQHFGPPNSMDSTLMATQRLLPPSAAHPFGTDDLGRDMFSRVIYGARISLAVGTLAVLVSVFIGLLLGAMSGYYQGALDATIMRFADVFLAFPYILFAILLLSVLPEQSRTSLMPVVLTIGLLGWPSIARVFRSSILGVKENDYVDAGRALGAGDLRLVLRHIMPNAIAPILVYATMSIGGAILTESALSFLGLGIIPDPVASPNAVSWGRMIDDGRMYLTTNPGVVIWPGLAILSTVLAFTLLGDGVRDALDVKMKD